MQVFNHAAVNYSSGSYADCIIYNLQMFHASLIDSVWTEASCKQKPQIIYLK